MSALDAVVSTLVDWLVETSVHVVVLVVIVAALVALLGRRLAPRWRYALWGLVALRLVLPVVPESPVSVHNLTAVFDVDGTGQADSSPRPFPPHAAPADAAPDDALDRSATGVTTWPSAAHATALPALAVGPPAVIEGGVSWWQRALVALWLGGAAAVAGWWLLVESRLRRRLRGAAVVTAPHVARALERACAEARVRRLPTVLVTDAVGSPALTGVRRPRLLLPARVAERFDERELLCVFRHEIAHLRAGDVLVNWVLAALSALHWFDPFVWFAFARLRAERESVRDWTALAHAGGSGRVAYGEALVRLVRDAPGGGRTRAVAVGILEGRREMTRRITMIATYRSSGLAGRVLGIGAVACVAAAALTGATADLVPLRAQDAGTAAPAAAPARRSIRVERETAEMPEDAAVRAKLRGPALDSVRGTMTLAELFAAYRKGLGVNIVVSPDAQESAADEPVDVPAATGLTAEQHLRLALRGVGFHFGVRDAVAFVGTSGERVGSIDRRFYDIGPIVEMFATRRRAAEHADSPGEELPALEEYANPEDVVALVQNCVHPHDDWTRAGTSLSVLGNLLVIVQTDDMHAKSLRVLDQLLNFGEPYSLPTEPWRQRLLEGLTRKITLDLKAVPLGEVAALITAEAGVRVESEAACTDRAVTLDVKDLSARQAVEWCARAARVHVVLRDGAVVFSELPETYVRLYDVHDLLTAKRAPVLLDALVEMTTEIEPRSWEEFATAEAIWPDMLVIRNTPAAHAGIEQLLATLRRLQEE